MDRIQMILASLALILWTIIMNGWLYLNHSLLGLIFNTIGFVVGLCAISVFVMYEKEAEK